MERALLERKTARRLSTVACDKFDQSLSEDPGNKKAVKAYYESLTVKHKKLLEVSNAVLHLLLDTQGAATDYDTEVDAAETYEDRWFLAEQSFLEWSTSEANQNFKGEEYKSVSGNTENKKRFRLPRLELPKFDGQIKSWLTFRGQFIKIHDDEDIDDGDKFQYLLQCMEHGSSARDLVESFPLMATNYVQQST
ncbi:hypothetical protein JYU34_015749 [Plutella xylostella]|uniref:Uncharacterized protein n=1 Tax=Plutella xylostella TaxID=51655 RepID=A0ABQ7Q5N7_PLUXY|nr:hypothetical protein JYU34_015749 [Plutella xylostella]